MTTAIIFPGQGSQSPEMISNYDAQPNIASAVNQAVQEASAALSTDLSAIIADKDALSQTANTQPALLAVCVGVYRGVQSLHADSPQPWTTEFINASFFAGHSLGEYTALVCANALDFSDAVRLVQQRGKLMQQSANGGMAAIIGEVDAINNCCEQVRNNGGKIWAVNYNSPQQTVVAGDSQSIAACTDWTSQDGIKRVLPLSVSIPSHCPLMQSAADALSDELNKITWHAPSPAIIHNAVPPSSTNTQTAEGISHALTAQLTSPVRWTDTIQHFIDSGITRIYECGPGGVLCGLGKRTPNAPPHTPLSSSTDIANLANG